MQGDGEQGVREIVRRREEIIAVIRKILVDDLHVQVPANAIELDAALFGTGLGLDSLDAVELVVATEQHFGVPLPMDVLRGLLRSVNTLTDLVIELQDQKTRAAAPSPTPSVSASASPSPSTAQAVAGAPSSKARSPSTTHTASPDGRLWTPSLRAIRESAAVTMLPGVWAISVRGDAAHDVLDRLVPCDLFVRDSQVRHTLLLDQHGRPFADVYLGNDDGDYLLLGEGPTAAQALDYLREHTRSGADVTFEDLSTSHSLISLNGPFAWEVMVALHGSGAIGFAYLSFFHPTPNRTFLRAGKTGEFGYELLVPKDEAQQFHDRLLEIGAPLDCRVASEADLRACARENWFFDIAAQRSFDDSPENALTPIELQLSWRVSVKKTYVGSEAVRARRENPRQRATAIRSAHAIERGDAVMLADGARVGVILDAGPAPTIGGFVGVALLETSFAHAGIDCFTIRGEKARTFSPPAVNNRSLFVNPQKHSYATRAEIALPESFARSSWIAE